ncbi:MAG: hypothetical protein AB2417_13330 [Clostridiaceae bacterium]
MNKNIFKMYFKRNVFPFLYLVIIAFILPKTNNYIPKLIMFIYTLGVLDSFISKKFKMLISFGCTRKKYYIDRIKISLINSLLLSIVCTILNFYGEGIKNINHIYKLFIFYFIFYILFSSIKIFIEILSISQYEALELGVLFFYSILYLIFIVSIIFGDTEWVLKNFAPYFWGSLASICFNMFMSTIALKTTEI